MTTLPYTSSAALVGQGGAAVDGAEDVACSIWPARSSRSDTSGHYHTHGGEADYAHRDALRVPNRSLVLGGETYKINSATPMPILRHVVLGLTLTSARS